MVWPLRAVQNPTTNYTAQQSGCESHNRHHETVQDSEGPTTFSTPMPC